MLAHITPEEFERLTTEYYEEYIASFAQREQAFMRLLGKMPEPEIVISEVLKKYVDPSITGEKMADFMIRHQDRFMTYLRTIVNEAGNKVVVSNEEYCIGMINVTIDLINEFGFE